MQLDYNDLNRQRINDEKIIKRRNARANLIFANILMFLGYLILGTSHYFFFRLIGLILFIVGFFLLLKSLYLFFVYKE